MRTRSLSNYWLSNPLLAQVQRRTAAQPPDASETWSVLDKKSPGRGDLMTTPNPEPNGMQSPVVVRV